ncbi:TetR/AcrR family transcriptional regulator [uncultured Jatrophihabitans sp.]|uniref:TetR/AcrR family transcriptional regulator n=1 Tax=uncultured Jatrophihabitans sp. TaxID=1610747 RepID=UPI0035CBEB38
MTNPLDTLFRTTAAPPPIASAAPVRTKGSHSRAGNAMSRTRSALLAGAAAAVEVSGTKIAMAQVAASAGVAKATLYNHFRTRDAVLDELVVAQVRAIVEDQAGKPLPTALADAAAAISGHPVRRGLARIEPATLAHLAVVDANAQGWQLARASLVGVLTAAGRGGADTVLRWLASYLITPSGPSAIAADVAVLLAGLPHVQPAAAQPGEAESAASPSSPAFPSASDGFATALAGYASAPAG